MRNAVKGDGASCLGQDGMMLIKGGAKRKAQHQANADLEEEDAQIELARQSGIDGDEPMKRKGKGKGKGHKRKKETGEDKPAAKRKAAAKSNKRKRPDPENPFDTPLDDDQKKLTELSTVKVTMPPKNTVKPESKVEVDVPCEEETKKDRTKNKMSTYVEFCSDVSRSCYFFTFQETQSNEKEEPKEVPKEKEEPKKVSKEKEEPKEVPKEKEEPKELAKEKDEPKEVPKEKEKPKEVPKEKEEPKELAKEKDEPKEVPDEKEEPKEVPKDEQKEVLPPSDTQDRSAAFIYRSLGIWI